MFSVCSWSVNKIRSKNSKTGIQLQNIKQTVWKMYSDLDGSTKTGAEKAETWSQLCAWFASVPEVKATEIVFLNVTTMFRLSLKYYFFQSSTYNNFSR